jgi:hypothetical protein
VFQGVVSCVLPFESGCKITGCFSLFQIFGDVFLNYFFTLGATGFGSGGKISGLSAN